MRRWLTSPYVGQTAGALRARRFPARWRGWTRISRAGSR